jgi:hypothetical protein
MIKNTLVLFSPLLVVGYCNAQKVLVNVFLAEKITKPKSDTIYYDPARLLTWNDFQGVPDQHHFGGAVTASGYAFDADIKIEGRVIYLNIGVYTFFSKKSSWKKPVITSDYHLLHEQHHFDITRISAENFINALVKAKFTKDNYQQLMSTLFDESYKECNRLQQQYDNETQHSIKREEQLMWNDKIAEMVKKL